MGMKFYYTNLKNGRAVRQTLTVHSLAYKACGEGSKVLAVLRFHGRYLVYVHLSFVEPGYCHMS